MAELERRARLTSIALIEAKLPYLTTAALADLLALLPTLGQRDPKLVELEVLMARLQRDLSNAGDRRDGDACDRIDREIGKVSRLLAEARKAAGES